MRRDPVIRLTGMTHNQVITEKTSDRRFAVSRYREQISENYCFTLKESWSLSHLKTGVCRRFVRFRTMRIGLSDFSKSPIFKGPNLN